MKPTFRIAAVTLRGGVILSAVLLIAGLALQVARPAPVATVSPEHLHAALAESTRLVPGSLLHLGLLVLLLTPIARIVAVAIDFVRLSEKSFVLLCIGVLFLLSISVTIGLR